MRPGWRELARVQKNCLLGGVSLWHTAVDNLSSPILVEFFCRAVNTGRESALISNTHAAIIRSLMTDFRCSPITSCSYSLTLLRCRIHSGKRTATVWRRYVCPSVCPIGILTVTHRRSACDAASVHLGPTVRRTDILVYCLPKMLTPVACLTLTVNSLKEIFVRRQWRQPTKRPYI